MRYGGSSIWVIAWFVEVFYLFTLGESSQALSFVPTSRWRTRSSPIDRGRIGLHRHVGTDRARSDRLNWRCSLTFSIIAIWHLQVSSRSINLWRIIITAQHLYIGVRVRGKAPRITSKIDLSAIKIVTLVKEEALTTGGEFSLKKGMGTLAGRGVGGSLSNRRVMSWSISLWIRAMQKENIYQIISTDHQQ
jgi:hypothetical protein